MNNPIASATPASSSNHPMFALPALSTRHVIGPLAGRHAIRAGLIALTGLCIACTPTAPGRAPTTARAPETSAGAPPSAPAAKEPTPAARLEPASFDDLPGWQADDLVSGFDAFRAGCPALKSQPKWTAVCTRSDEIVTAPPAAKRAFLQREFIPHRVVAADGRAEGLLTGYYEPLIRGSRSADSRFRFPIYGAPDDLISVDLATVVPDTRNLRLRGRVVGRKLIPYWTRADIDAGRAPLQGHEIAWSDDAVDLFFLQVQGSGRLQLENGEILRIGYADQNGHPYRSIGRLLVERGDLSVDQASMQGIRAWGRANPDRLAALLNENPSYVFFRELPPNNDGPLGSLGVPLTAGRSLAVDPSSIPMGAPVYVDSTWPGTSRPLSRLMAAQDTGGAIKGAVRADYFWGFGPDAGEQAGRMRQPLRLWVLLPRNY
ncbi:MAG: MltA domain-containing protein [Burkholderiales bacterium]